MIQQRLNRETGGVTYKLTAPGASRFLLFNRRELETLRNEITQALEPHHARVG